MEQNKLMADENKNKNPEEKNEIREKEKSKVDQGTSWYERAFLYAKSNPEAVADGIVGITSGVARVIKNGNLQYDLDKNKCPPKGEETKKEEKQDFEEFKNQAKNIYTDLKSFKTGKPLKDIALETNLNFKLKEFPECIEQEFAGFFNYVPISYYISKLLSDATSTLTTAGIEELREDEGECKEANNEILDNILNITDNYLPTSIPTIPRIPLIPTNLWDGLLREVVLSLLCEVISNIVRLMKEAVAKVILAGLDDLSSFAEDFNFGLNISSSRYSDFGLQKINLNKYISNQAIIEAVEEDLLLSKPDIIARVRNYFDLIQEDDDILQRQLLLLLIGEVECSIINQLIEKDKQIGVGLDTEKKVILFFRFLKDQINMIGLLENSKDLECIPDYCVEITKKAEEDIKNAIDAYCDLLNPKIMEALDQIKVDDFFDNIGLGKVIEDNQEKAEKRKKYIDEIKEVFEDYPSGNFLSDFSYKKSNISKYKENKDKNLQKELEFLFVRYFIGPERLEQSPTFKDDDGKTKPFFPRGLGIKYVIPGVGPVIQKDIDFSSFIKNKYEQVKENMKEKKFNDIFFGKEEKTTPIFKIDDKVGTEYLIKKLSRVFLLEIIIDYCFYQILEQRQDILFGAIIPVGKENEDTAVEINPYTKFNYNSINTFFENNSFEFIAKDVFKEDFKDKTENIFEEVKKIINLEEYNLAGYKELKKFFDERFQPDSPPPKNSNVKKEAAIFVRKYKEAIKQELDERTEKAAKSESVENFAPSLIKVKIKQRINELTAEKEKLIKDLK